MKKQLLLILTALMLSLGATAQMVLQFDTTLSDGTTITLPLKGAVDVTVDWGDGTTDAYTTSGNQDHTYAAEGTYIVKISGSLTLFGNGMNAIPNIDKLIGVISFGDIGLTSLSGAFNGAKNLTQVPAILPSTVKSAIYMFYDCTSFNFDISGWDVSKIVNMAHMFNSATSFNQDIGSWNVGNVSDMYRLFYNATSFNQDISGWDVRKVTTMSKIFEGVTLSTANYNSLLIGWAGQTVKKEVYFGGGNNRYSPGAAADARTVLTDTYSWTISDGGQLPENAMVLEFNTNLSDGKTITLPLHGEVDVTIGWGDGRSNTYTTAGNYDHTYGAEGTYTVSISGNLTQFGNGSAATSNTDKLVKVTSFGDIGLTSLSGAFKGATNLTQVPSSLPLTVTNTASMFSGATTFNQDIGGWDVSNVTNMSSMFAEASAFNQNIGSWNVSNVTNMRNMFNAAESFNQNIGNWNVSNVTNMSRMFWEARAFNQNIGNWNVSNVTNMSGMFWEARAFNQKIGAWDVSKVTDMSSMFHNARNFNQNIGAWKVSKVTDMSGMFESANSFNQNIGAWDVSNVTDMSNMFSEAAAFNQNISSWNVSNVTDMSGMFHAARAFNQNIGAWDVSSVTDMYAMFENATSFNQDISDWDVSSVTDMSGMFWGATSFDQDISSWNVSQVTHMGWMFCQASAFNQDIGSWDVSQVTEMRYMFENAIMFNQDISYWDVSSVTTMQSMFENAAVFDQDLGAWNVTKVANFTDMFNGANLSVDNYNNLLIGWAGKAVRTGRNFNAGNSMYSAIVSSAKSTLTNTYGWTITDGGLIDDDAMVLIFDTNLSAGTTIALPLQGAVDVTVSWGDSNIDNFNTAGNKTHTYDADGVYTVIITGSLTQFGNSLGYDSKKLTRVTNWGNLGLTSLSGAFIFASNLTNVPNSLPSGITNTSYMFNDCYKFNANISNWDVSSVTDMYAMFENATSFNQDISDWDVSSVTNMSVMFQDAISFNQDISYWNVSSVTDMSGMFWNATSFDQNIRAWNISNVTTMHGMFGGVTLSTANYDDMLITWANEIPYYGVQPFVPFDGGNSKYSISAVNARESLVQHRWAITDGGIEIPENAMVLEFNTNLSEGNTITLPLQGSLSTVSVYWGDNSANTYTTAGNYDHTYANAGEYTVYIAGYLSQFGNGNTGYTNTDKLVGVTDFGNLGTSSFHGAFKGATNLTQVPSSLPLTVTNTASMFSGATTFNQDIGGWDVSNVTNMNSMFYEASAFNQDIGSWNVSNVTDMESMFYRATAFNQDIGNWDVGKVTSLFCMFCEASAFNQDIGSWNVSNVTDMFFMFKDATTFNQNLGGWDVSNVTDMEGMFEGITLSTANYDNLLIGWAKKYVSYDVSFHGGNSTYSPGAAADARAVLTGAMNNWTITDGGESTASAVNSTLAETMGVYPNPFQNTINISNASNAKRVVITNVVGKVVMVVDLNQVSNEVIETNVPSGMYLVTIFANDGSRVVRKMVRE